MANERDLAIFAIRNNALSKGSLPQSLTFFRFGDNQTDQGVFRVTERTIAALRAQAEKGVYDKPIIDFEHNSLKESPTFQPPPRHHAGVGVLFASKERGVGLDHITWTPKGEEFARNYPDISPVTRYDKETGEILSLESAGLVPASGVVGLSFFSAIEPSSQEDSTKQETNMDIAEIKKQIDALGEALAALKKQVEGMNPVKADEIPKKEDVAAMSAKATQLEASLADLKKDTEASFAKRDKSALIQQAAFAGKVIQLTDDAIEKLSVDDLKGHIAKLPVTVPLQSRIALFAPKPEDLDGTSLIAQFNAITDPDQRAEFYEKNKGKMFA